MYFSRLVYFLDLIEKEASRNSKIVNLSELFKNLDTREIPVVIYLLDARLAPRYEPLEFNFSNKMILRALNYVNNHDNSQLYKQKGDIGLVAEEILKNNKDHNELEIMYIYDSLKEMAMLSGKGSQEFKILKFKEIILQVDSLSARYISRIVEGNMRLGLNDKTVLDALSWCINNDKSIRPVIERAYGIRSDLGYIAQELLESGVTQIEKIKVKVGTPMSSKLVEREKDVHSIYQRLQDSIVQPKYDGLRAQIHFCREGIKLQNSTEEKLNDQNFLESTLKNNTAIYSRNMENYTKMFPDIVQKLDQLKVDSLIIDSEINGYDYSQNKFIPFQETSQRKRKYGIENISAQIPVKVMIFDCLYLNGEDLTLYPLVKRLEILKTIFYDNDDMFMISESNHVTTENEISFLFNKYKQLGLEGIIVKDPNSVYKPGTRDFDWIKLKAASQAGFIDNIDAVVLGYYTGRGKRTDFGIGAMLLGIYDKQKDKYVTIAKLGTGVKDDQWKFIVKRLNELKQKSKPDNVEVDKFLSPDVWVTPKIVVEVEYDEITISKGHTAGRDKDTALGYSLRFPRMKVFGRDKLPEDSTSLEEVIRLYNLKKS